MCQEALVLERLGTQRGDLRERQFPVVHELQPWELLERLLQVQHARALVRSKSAASKRLGASSQ